MINDLKLGLKTAAGVLIQFMLFHRLMELLIGGFFAIFIYRVTNDFRAVVIGQLIYYVGVSFGYLLVSKVVHRLGYSTSIKLSFLIQALTYLLASTLFSELSGYIYIFSFSYGVAHGVFFCASNLLQLAAIPRSSQRQTMYLLEGVIGFFGAIFPVIAGIVIVSSGYRELLVMSGLIMLVAVAFPAKAKLPKPDKFHFRELRLTTKLAGFTAYVYTLLVESFVEHLRNVALIMIPFLLLGKSELNVGLLASAIAIISSITAISLRSRRNTDRFGIWSAWLFFPLNLILGLAWNAYGVALRALLMPFGLVFYNSVARTYQFENMHTLLGHHLNEDGIELQIIRELTLFSGRLLASITFLILLGLDVSFEQICRLIIIVFAIWPVFRLQLMRILQQKLTQLKSQI